MLVSLPPAQRRLLSILLLNPRQAWTAETLIERMWGDDPPASARNALQVHIGGLRRWLPIETTDTGYRLVHNHIELDRDRFESLVARAVEYQAAAQWGSAVESAREALALWRGTPFSAIDGEAYTVGTVTRTTELLLRAADVEVDALLQGGRNGAAISRLTQLIDDHPYRDRLRHRLLLALYRDGRQSDALREYQSYRKLLGETLGIEPGNELKMLEEQILLHDPQLGRAPEPRVPHNLPSISSSFISRDEDLRLVLKELAHVGVVTVTGEPGVGKTRLAIEVGFSALEDHPGGAWFVDLTGATDTRSVIALVAATVSVDDEVDTINLLTAAIRTRPMLLILDNCEHIIEEVRSFVVALSAEPGRCRILLTSRRPLRLGGDSVHRLRPLGINGEESVALLVDRARDVDRSFAMSSAAGEAALELCRLLDGNPLAIELVARWLPSLGVVDTTRLLGRVSEESALAAAVDWSLKLLPTGDAAVLASLATFRSPFTLVRANELANLGDREMAIAGSVSRLVEASLLRVGSDHLSVRYRMLPPVRDLMNYHLSPESRAALAESHRASFLRSAKVLVADWQGDRHPEVLGNIGLEIADYRAALEALVESGEWAGMITVCEALVPYWYANFLSWEGLAWLTDLPIDELDERTKADYHRVAGFLLWAIHDYDGSDRQYLELESIGVRLGERAMEADGLYGQGLIHQKRRFKKGAAMLDRAAMIYEDLLPGTARQLGECLLFRGIDDAYWGDVDVGEARLLRAASLLEGTGHLRQISKAERWMAHCCWRRGDLSEGQRYATRAEELARALGDKIALAGAMVEQANIAIARSDVQASASLLIEALAPVPSRDEIDLAQVLIPVARLAVHLDDHRVAGAVLDWVEDAFRRHGWRPLNEIPTARPLREQAPRNDVERSSDETRAVAWAFLESVAATGRHP